MTMTVTKAGLTSLVVDETVVADALRQHHIDASKLGKGFLRYWIDQGKSVDEILEIVGVRSAQRRTA